MRRTKEVARLTDALKRYISILLQLSVVINYARYAWIEFMHYSLDRVQRGLYRTLLLKRIVRTDISVSWHKFICLKFLNKCSKIDYSWDVYSSRPISLLMKKIIWIFFLTSYNTSMRDCTHSRVPQRRLPRKFWIS